MDKIAILHQLDKRPTNSLSDRPPTQKGLKKKKHLGMMSLATYTDPHDSDCCFHPIVEISVNWGLLFISPTSIGSENHISGPILDSSYMFFWVLAGLG